MSVWGEALSFREVDIFFGSGGTYLVFRLLVWEISMGVMRSSFKSGGEASLAKFLAA
jgi:hypothetical protein